MKLLFLSCLLILTTSISSEAQSSSGSTSRSCTDRYLNNYALRVDRLGMICDRSQNRVEQWQIRKNDALERLKLDEELSNTQQGTNSVRCWLREALPGECAARRRRRNYALRKDYLERYYDRRIAQYQRLANRDCTRFANLQESLTNQVATCSAPLSSGEAPSRVVVRESRVRR